MTDSTCGMSELGTLNCWGSNWFGKLGDGTMTNRLTPVAVEGLTKGVTAVAVGSYHTCGLDNRSRVRCWGYNAYGQLGNGTTTNEAFPFIVPRLRASAIAAGYYHTCAVTQRARVKCWGHNDLGQLGNDTTDDADVPDAVVGIRGKAVAIAAGGYHTCVLMASGGVKCWGDNANGQLGNGAITAVQTTPVDVVGLTSGIVAITAGSYHTCAVTKTGHIKCWGKNDHGQLGDGTTTNRSTPVDVLGF